MANILIIGLDFPDDLASGRHLRVHHLCRVLASTHSCYYADLSGHEPGQSALSRQRQAMRSSLMACRLFLAR